MQVSVLVRSRSSDIVMQQSLRPVCVPVCGQDWAGAAASVPDQVLPLELRAEMLAAQLATARNELAAIQRRASGSSAAAAAAALPGGAADQVGGALIWEAKQPLPGVTSG